MTIATFHDLAGCELELVPDAGIGLTGSNLTTWSDQSGKTRHATLANVVANGFATATGPIYAASDAAFGGKPSVTWGNPTTSCLDTPLFTAIPSPITIIVAGQDRSQLNASSRAIGDRLPAAASGGFNRVTFFRPQGSTGSPEDTLLIPWSSTAPNSQASRRIVGASLRAPFVLGWINRATPGIKVVHNGIVRADRAAPTTGGSAPAFSGMRLGRDFTNSVDGQEWVGPLSLFVVYSRELTTSELKDALALASSKCGISIVTGRVAA